MIMAASTVLVAVLPEVSRAFCRHLYGRSAEDRMADPPGKRGRTAASIRSEHSEQARGLLSDEYLRCSGTWVLRQCTYLEGAVFPGRRWCLAAR
jgi:hypothetical protein